MQEQENQKKLQAISEIKSVDSWLDKRNTVDISYGSSDDSNNLNQTPYVPLESNFYKSLPLSLRRLEITNFLDTEIPEWG